MLNGNIRERFWGVKKKVGWHTRPRRGSSLTLAETAPLIHSATNQTKWLWRRLGMTCATVFNLPKTLHSPVLFQQMIQHEHIRAGEILDQ